MTAARAVIRTSSAGVGVLVNSVAGLTGLTLEGSEGGCHSGRRDVEGIQFLIALAVGDGVLLLGRDTVDLS